VRTQECVIDARHRAFSADITTLCHNFLSEMLVPIYCLLAFALEGDLKLVADKQLFARTSR
jgi:hypothetical protein